mgnify:CR=1 FL=1
MKKATLLSFLILCSALQLTAQAFSHWNIPFIQDGEMLDLATAGGLNNPQPNEIDLNDDGLLDLLVFDRTGNVLLPFINSGGAYEYAPQYARYFPQGVAHWMILRDYNDDGVMDLFVQAQGFEAAQGVAVFRGYYENGHIAFERFPFDYAIDIIPFELLNGTQTQLYVSNIDYPAIDDIDCDGDLDILTFNPSGGFIELYANRSIEEGYGKDSLLFELEEDCWGGVFENSVEQALGLASAPGQCFDQLLTIETRHPGSTLLTFDSDNDGDKDMLLGDITYSTLNFLHNGGDCSQAWVNDQELNYPADGLTADIPLFPAAFLADVDFDGKRDLLVAPNSVNISEDREVLWVYGNQGTQENPDFSFAQRDFLVGEMLDLGTGASPALVDYNADGLLDLVVGNEGAFEPGGNKDTRLYLFENVGSAQSPEFELVDDDYLGLSVFDAFTTFSPTFGDLDSDGDLDILVGEINGELFYAENTAGAGQPLSFGPWVYGYMDIDVGNISVPQIIDLDRDGLNDLVIGERTGNVNFFKNIGTPSAPMFNPDVNASPNQLALGNINTAVPGSISGYSAPLVLDQNGEYILITGTQGGALELYNQIDGNLQGSFQLDTEMMGGIQVGARTKLAAADLDNDGLLELIVGNQRGGLSAFQTPLRLDSTSPVEQVAGTEPIKLFPNPATAQLQLRLPASVSGAEARLFSSTGQLVRQWQGLAGQSSLNTTGLPDGVYFLRVQHGRQLWSERVVLNR